jgi:hypothetical protein
MQILGGERVPTRNMRKADGGVHHRELARMIQLEAGDPFPIREMRRLRELPQLAAIEEGFEDVLLNRLVAIGHDPHGLAQGTQRRDRFGYSEVSRPAAPTPRTDAGATYSGRTHNDSTPPAQRKADARTRGVRSA